MLSHAYLDERLASLEYLEVPNLAVLARWEAVT